MGRPSPLLLLLLLIGCCAAAIPSHAASSPSPSPSKAPASPKKTSPSPGPSLAPSLAASISSPSSPATASPTATTASSASISASSSPSSTTSGLASTSSTAAASPSSSSSSSPAAATAQPPTRNVSIEPRVKSTTSGSGLHTATTKRASSFPSTPPSSGSSTASPSATTSAKGTRESPGKIRPQIKLTTNYTSASETGVRLPEGASAALAKPTKYHYYPHNQHIYLLPECAVQQVCNAVYVRLNFTQPLCACPGRYRDPCSASLDSDDLHTTELVTDSRTKALTLVKTCEPVAEMRECRAPRDWSLLALQNVRTGKSHYLVICRCPDTNILEGPMSHDQPTYASVPGIRVYGMMCVQGSRRGSTVAEHSQHFRTTG